MSNGYTPDDKELLRQALASSQNTSGEGPTPELVAALQKNGYISSQQARNPSTIPWRNGGPDPSDPQFRGLPALSLNSGPDQAAQKAGLAAAPDLRYGTGASGQANTPPPPSASPAAPQVPALSATPLPNPFASSPGGDGQGPSAPRPTVLPEHWVNTMAPEDRPKLEAGQQAQLHGVEDQAAAEAEGSDAVAQLSQRAAEDQRIQQLKDKQEYDRQNAAIQGHMQQLQERADLIGKQQIDPMHVFGEKGTGERTGNQVIAAVAMGLGAAGAALSHGENSAAKIIQQQIDADIAAQHAKIQNSKEGLETQRGLLADKLKLFGNLPQAQAAARQEMLQASAAEIDATAKRFNSPVVLARAEQMKGELMHRFAQEDASVKKFVPAQVVGGGAGQGVSDVKPDEVVTLPDGRQVTVPTADREQVVGALRQHQMVTAAANHARQLLAVPITSRGPGWVKDYDATQEVLAKSELVGGGKGGKGLIEMNAAAGGGRTLTFTPGVEQALRTLEQGSAQNAQAAADNTAQYEVEPQLTVNPKTGEQERKYRIRGQYQRKNANPAPPKSFTPVGQ